MGRGLMYTLLILICLSSLYCSIVPCLTWRIIREKLTFTCRLIGFSHPVSLVDSQGQLYGKCTFSRHGHNCNPVDRKDLIDVHYSRKSIVFNVGHFNESANGIWVCLQDKMRLTTQVSLSKGILDSTEISITGTVLNATIFTTKHVINCFSCREPDGGNVEFLVNGRTEDSVTYNRDTGNCTHHKGECHPDECSCNGNMFQQAFQFGLKSNGLLYTCDMLFTDSLTQAVFSKNISISFKGEGFYNISTSTNIIKPGLIWSKTLTTIESEKELEPTQTTVTEILDKKETGENRTVENSDKFPTSYVIIITVLSLMVCILVILLICRSKKRQYSNLPQSQEMAEIEEHPVPLVGNSLFGDLSNSLVCGSCAKQSKKRPALFLCINCEIAHCGLCSREHSIDKETSHHKCFSMSMVAANVLLTITCEYHKQLKFQFNCVRHNVLCCNKCTAKCHREPACTLVKLDSISNDFMQTADFIERNITQCLDYLVGIIGYLYFIIDEITNSYTLSGLSIEKDVKSLEIQKIVKHDVNDIKNKMHNHASQSENLITIVREQKDVFNFIKEHGTQRQLFILKQRMDKIEERVYKMFDKTKDLNNNVERLRRYRVVSSTASEAAYRELKNMSIS